MVNLPDFSEAWLNTPAPAKLFLILLTFMVADIITGLLAAWYHNKVSSKVGRQGLIRKASIIIGVLIGGIVEELARLAPFLSGIPDGITLSFIAAAAAMNELLSITENLDRVGVTIPGFTAFIKGRRETRDNNDPPTSPPTLPRTNEPTASGTT